MAHVTILAGGVRIQVPFENLPAAMQEKLNAHRATYRQRVAEAEAGKDEILRLGRQYMKESEKRIAERRALLNQLRTAREAQGLSLSDIETRAGFGKAFLSRLETDVNANPTVDTLQRYAEALGAQLTIGLTEAPPARSPRPRRKPAVTRK